MKHLLRSVVALGILAVPAVASAQVTGGFRVRFNLADLVFPSESPMEVAGFATVPINDVLAFQPEVVSSLQATKVSATAKVDYYQVPLLGRVRFGKGSPVAVLAGPSVALWMRTDEFGEYSEIRLTRFDVGYVAGVGIEADHGVLDWRYTWGLPDLMKNGVTGARHNGSAKRRVLSLSAGWRF